MADVVEVMARGIAGVVLGQWEKASAQSREACMNDARAALSALSDAGYVVVPKNDELSKALADYKAAYDLMDSAMKDNINVQGALSGLVGAETNLLAMLSAAPAPK